MIFFVFFEWNVFSLSLNSSYLFEIWISNRFSMLWSKPNRLFPEKKSELGEMIEQSWNCWGLRGWCYELITFMRIIISKTIRYVVSNLLLLEISISAFVCESLGSRSKSRHEESVCIFLILFRISRNCQMNSELCQRLLWTDCDSGLPPVSILQPVFRNMGWSWRLQILMISQSWIKRKQTFATLLHWHIHSA